MTRGSKTKNLYFDWKKLSDQVKEKSREGDQKFTKRAGSFGGVKITNAESRKGEILIKGGKKRNHDHRF